MDEKHTHDDALDTLLRRRSYAPPGDDLVHRIIAASAMLPQRRAFSLADWVTGVFADLHLPRPAYAMASLLLIGFIMGLSAAASERDPARQGLTVYLQDFTGNDDEGALL